MKNRMRSLTAPSVVFLVLFSAQAAVAQSGARFEVSFAAAVRSQPLTGRLLVALSSRPAPEPRMAFSFTGVPAFAVDVEQLQPGAVAVVDDKALGYPFMRMKDLPPGDYFAQR